MIGSADRFSDEVARAVLTGVQFGQFRAFFEVESQPEFTAVLVKGIQGRFRAVRVLFVFYLDISLDRAVRAGVVEGTVRAHNQTVVRLSVLDPVAGEVLNVWIGRCLICRGIGLGLGLAAASE